MQNNTNIKAALLGDVPKLKTIVSHCGLFEFEEISFMHQMIEDHFAQSAPKEKWLISEQTAAYVAPEVMSGGAWNVLFIATMPEARSRGHGARMMGFIEAQLRASDARLLLVETSGTSRFDRTRAFYDRLGYERCGRIAQYFGPGDDKVIYMKTL